MRWNDRLELVDTGLGFVGFFAFAFLVITAVCELTAQPALGWAVTTLALVLAFIALLQARQRIAASRRRDATYPGSGEARSERDA